MKKVLFVLAMLFVLAYFGKALAIDPEVFDSTDNYLGVCQLTNTSTWTTKEDLNVTTFQIWYKWNQGETSLPITLTKDGNKFATFTATRGKCDPYQATWCNADYSLNKIMPKGTYSTKIANKQQCLKPGSTGTVRLYGNHEISSTTSANSTGSTCKNSNSTILYCTLTFILTSIIFFYIGKSKK